MIHFVSFVRIPPMSESLHTLNKEFNRTRQDVDQLGATLRSFKDLLRKLILVQNVSRTSGGVIRRIRKKKLLVKTGQVNRHLPRKKGRIPRLRTRLPAARPQRNSSPRMCNFVPLYFLYFFLVFTSSFS